MLPKINDQTKIKRREILIIVHNLEWLIERK